MKTTDFDYQLPEELIAQVPVSRRDEARMLVLHRASQSWEHRLVKDLPEYLTANDLLVLNNTKVIPARLFGNKQETGGRVELLLLEEKEPDVWDVLMKTGRRPKPGARITLGNGDAVAEMIEDGEMGRALIRIHSTGAFMDFLQRDGVTPLPPYISRNYTDDQNRPLDMQRYQTIYASTPGAVAAPTAGLHFTDELFDKLTEKGVSRAEITLHVGIGTFRPVAVDDVTKHVMDEERFELSEATADAIKTAKEHGRVVAVGSTTVRTLETVAAQYDEIKACSGRSDLFIYPPYSFRVVDVMLTNFHLPKSTLLMMVSALAGRDFMLYAYEEAVKEKYRFYSYGDCMLIL